MIIWFISLEFTSRFCPRRILLSVIKCPNDIYGWNQFAISLHNCITNSHSKKRFKEDLCIASSRLLAVIDPLPMDRLSRHTVAEIRAWPAADRHDLLAVANRDVRVARQNIAEMILYVDDHAAHLANCASADDDNLTLMSAELLPRLEGGSGQP